MQVLSAFYSHVGEKEALFGLYAANYLSGTYSSISGNPENTVGACDLGGESLEIGYFPPNNSSPVARSFPSMGANNVIEHVVQYLLNTQDGVVENPCYPLGYSEFRGKQVVLGTAQVAM